MLPRLAALATASARLHNRSQVLAFPDAVLAVKVAEESCAAKVSLIEFLLGKQCHNQNPQGNVDSATAMPCTD